MPEQALYLKWRPLAFDEMVGQEHITRTLRNALKSDRVRHAYLFSGPRGTGKTTTARLLAKAVNCLHPDPDQRPCNVCAACVAVNEGRFLDLIEIDAATHTGVDDVRDLREKIAFSPGEGRYKIYIIDEVHRFSGSAFDALLKTLEEPPEHAIFVLATTEIDKVPATIKSRCLQFEFRRFSVQEVTDRLHAIISAEGIQAERAALEMVAREGTGSMRDSISLLDQIITDPDEPITLSLVQRILGTASHAAVRDLTDALINDDAAGGLRVIRGAMDGGTDPRQFGQQMVEHLRYVLLTQTGGAELVEASAEDKAAFSQQAGRISRHALMKAVRAFNDAVNNFKGGWQPQLALELALLESLRAVEEPVAQVTTTVVASLPANGAEAPQVVAAAITETVSLPTDPNAPALTLAHVQEKWGDIQQYGERYKRNLRSLTVNLHPVELNNNVLKLQTSASGFFDAIHRATEPARQNKEAIERAIYEILKARIAIQVIVGELAANDTGKKPTHADPLLNAAQQYGAKIGSADKKSN